MNKKLFYTQPTTDILELRGAESLLQASIIINSANNGYDVDIDLGEI